MPRPVFAVKGAALLTSRQVINEVGLFDGEFWSYYEDADFCHRVLLAGYDCWYYPQAVLYHAGGGTSQSFDDANIQFHNFKNKLMSFLKNLSPASLLYILPLYLALSSALSSCYVIIGKSNHSAALARAVWYNVCALPVTLQKRRRTQRLRRRSDTEINLLYRVDPRPSYYLALFRDVARYADDPVVPDAVTQASHPASHQ